jgi:hypothetical protein
LPASFSISMARVLKGRSLRLIVRYSHSAIGFLKLSRAEANVCNVCQQDAPHIVRQSGDDTMPLNVELRMRWMA